MTAFSASSGRASSDEVGERIAVDDDEVGERTRLDHADPVRRVHQQLPGVAGAPAEDVGRRQAVDLAVEGELAAVVADLVVERVVLDQVRNTPL